MGDINILDLAPYVKANFSDLYHINLEFTYNQDTEIKKVLFATFDEEIAISDAVFDQLFDKSYANLIQQVGQYVDEVLLDSSKNSLFPNFNSYLIQGASVILGMHATDHLLAINRLETYISKNKKGIEIYRIKSEITRRNQFTNLYMKIRNSTKSLVIVEKTESMGVSLLESLIDSLHTILTEDPSKRITVLFCMSSNFKPLNRLLPISVSTRMHYNKLIVSEVEDISRNLDQYLINMNCNRFSIGSNLVETIASDFAFRDPTLANLKYIYQYCLFHHFRKTHTVANLNKKDLVKLLKSHPSLIKTIKSLDSVVNYNTNRDWTSNTTVASFCVEQSAICQAHDKFIKNQIAYYFYLLKDDLGQNFPSDLNDLYSESMNHDGLACSFKFADAVQKLKSYPINSILKRIDKALLNCKKDSTKDKNDVYTIFTKFKGKFENNDDSKQLVFEFINSLLEHAQLLINPLKLPLSELLYCDDTVTIRKRLMPMTRYDVFKAPEVTKSYFDAIYSSILRYKEEVSEADLYDEFKHFMEEKKHINEFDARKIYDSKAMTPNKRARRSVRFENIDKSSDNGTNLDEGLLKAIFIDTLENIEQQGLIKRTSKDSKKGMLRRHVWP